MKENFITTVESNDKKNYNIENESSFIDSSVDFPKENNFKSLQSSNNSSLTVKNFGAYFIKDLIQNISLPRFFKKICFISLIQVLFFLIVNAILMLIVYLLINQNFRKGVIFLAFSQNFGNSYDIHLYSINLMNFHNISQNYKSSNTLNRIENKELEYSYQKLQYFRENISHFNYELFFHNKKLNDIYLNPILSNEIVNFSFFVEKISQIFYLHKEVKDIKLQK